MAASYVVVTAAAVVLVEAIGLVGILPGLLSQLDMNRRVSITAGDLAGSAARANEGGATLTLPSDFMVGDPTLDPSKVRAAGSGLAIPYVEGKLRSMPAVGVILNGSGVVIASSFPNLYAVGRRWDAVLPMRTLSNGAQTSLPKTTAGGVAKDSNGLMTWAVEPIWYPDKAAAAATENQPTKGTGKGGPDVTLIGWAYVQAPGAVLGLSGGPLALAPVLALKALPSSSVGPLITAGGLLLLLLLPVGTAFGVLTSRRLVRRLGALATATGAFAGGELGRRVSVGRDDEVGRLESGFNEMASRIQEMTRQQARLADERARTEERERIARELHDSISQDLFSVSLIAGGFQRALPADSPLQNEVAALRDTVSGAMSEMRALLLELRPAALDERGLVPALEDLCAAYEQRLGVSVDARFDPIDVAPPADHAMLRVAQEGIANAVRHSDARRIRVRLGRRHGRTELVVADDGRGFDQSKVPAHGLGLRVMRERVRELGGSLVISSRPGRGTRLVASIPT
jgi:signal transduction histidine kinase